MQGEEIPIYCYTCKQTKLIKSFKYDFNCNHSYCLNCLFHLMFINNIQDFKNIEICHINCLCKKGFLEMDLKQINDMLKLKAQNEQNSKFSYNEREICSSHNLKQNFFCKNCQMYICEMCKGDKHKSHTTIENSKYALLYKDFIKHMPLRFKSIEEFIVNFEKVANNFKNQIQDDINNTINNINDLINNLVKIRAEYAKNIKEKYEQGSMSLNILKLFYWNFYTDYSNMGKCEDIFLLKYLININYEFINMELTYNKKMFDQLNIIKNQADILKKSTDELFYLKFEYQKLPREYSLSSKLFGHKDQITSLLVLKDQKLLSGSLDYSIRIWEEKQINLFINTERIEQFVKPITCLCQISDGRILSSAIKDNNTIRIWNKNSNEYECETTLSKHQDIISCIIQLKDGRIVSGSKDNRIIIWNISDNYFFFGQELSEHKRGVYCVFSLKNGKIVSGGEDNLIIIWKEDNKKQFFCEQILTYHKSKVRCVIELNDGRLVSTGDDNNLVFWIEKDKKYIFDIEIENAHSKSITRIIQLKNNNLATCSKDKNIIIWEKKDNSFIQKQILKEHNRLVNCIVELNNGNIASAGADNNIIIWKSGVMME